jgi:hypothetical protein
MLTHTQKWSWLKAWAMSIAKRRGQQKAIVALGWRLAAGGWRLAAGGDYASYVVYRAGPEFPRMLSRVVIGLMVVSTPALSSRAISHVYFCNTFEVLRKNQRKFEHHTMKLLSRRS